jgi:hypothetical protein
MADTSLSACLAEIKANPGKFYVYVLSRPCGMPFYVGVGSKWRISFHEYEAVKRAARTHKSAIIRKLLASGEGVSYAIVGWFDTWDEGAAVERQLIAKHGRRDLGTGILANRTDGGEGAPNIKWQMTEARAAGIARAAEKSRGRKLTEDHKARTSASLKGRENSAETRARLSRSLTGRTFSEETLNRMSKGQRRRAQNGGMNLDGLRKWHAANIDQVAETQRNKWKDPEYRNRLCAALKGVGRSVEYSEGNRQRQIAKFADPAFRNRWAVAHTEAMSDPEFRRKQSEITKAKWADPEFRAKMMAARHRARVARAPK